MGVIKKLVEHDYLSSIRWIALTLRQADITNSLHQEACSHEQSVPSHLQHLCQRSYEMKTAEEKELIEAILLQYQDVFSKDENDLGRVSLTEHTIDRKSTDPIKQAPRRVPLEYAEAEKNCIKDQEQKGVLQKSTSSWASLIV